MALQRIQKAHCIGIVVLAVLATFGTACQKGKIGSKGHPLAMYFVPSVDTQSLAVGAEKLGAAIAKKVSQRLYQKDTGFYIKTSVPTSYVAVVEAFGTSKADFAALNTFSYILAKDIKKYPVDAAFTILRGAGERTYRGQIIAHKDSGIKNLQDLKGKRFAYTDPASTAGYILPMQLFKEKGITLGGTVFAMKHDNVVTMVYQKQVDAGATFYSPPNKKMVDGKEQIEYRDARLRVVTQFPDVFEKVQIIDFTREIPNEPWVIRTNLDPDPVENEKIKTALVESILEYSKTDEGKAVLEALYSISGLSLVQDSEYNEIRKIVKESNLDLEKEIQAKKK